MGDASSRKAVEGPSPMVGLSLLGLIAFVAGGSMVAEASQDADVARTGGLVLVGVGLYAIVVGAVAVGVRLVHGNR